MTMLIDKQGNTKIAQYGQWDGYPSGQGITILEFIRDKENMSKLLSKLDNIRFLDDIADKEFIDDYNSKAPKYTDSQDDRTPEQIEWFNVYQSRDIGGDILKNVANSTSNEILLTNSEEDCTGDTWVEYCYVINLQKNTFEIYNQTDNPILKSYNLDELPSNKQFLQDLKEEEE